MNSLEPGGALLNPAAEESVYGWARGAAAARRFAIATILLFWVAQFTILSLARLIRNPDGSLQSLLPRGMVALAGVGLSLAILFAQSKARQASLALRTVLAVACALIGCLLHGLINEAVFSIYFESEFGLGWSFLAFLDWFWFYLSLSVMILVLSHNADIADSKVQIESLKSQTTLAQLSALRYQLNPHFLFNTLNSIAALVVENQPTKAELMIRRLSTFLRGGLATDPLISIPLAAEIAQQRLYLEIEQTRFPDRLAFRFDIPDALAGALVPSLILQPLVENAVKYAVAPSGGLTTISISAREDNGALRIDVRDDGPGLGASEAGAGIGHANVRQRLAAEFGDQATFEAHAAERGYRVSLRLPLRRAAS